MDQPQADYFKIIAERMPENSKIILCSAEPGWLYTDKNEKSFEIIDYAVGIATRVNRNLAVPILLSGDTHHYSRYATEAGLQFITSGGGGAFLHPTHQLDDEITIRWLSRPTTLSLKRDPTTNKPTDATACYPPQKISGKLLWRNLWFPLTNWDFAVLMGIFYWIIAVAVTLRPAPDAYFIVFAMFAGAFTAYTRYQEKSKRCAVYTSGILQGLGHTCAAIFLSKGAAILNAGYFVSGQWYDVWLWLLALLFEVGILGGVIGAFLFGLNLLITCRWFNMNDNDAFSALRLDTFRNFLRIKIKDNEVTIFAIGLDSVPRRHEWQPNPKAAPGNPDESVFLPTRQLAPHLIEKPIAIRG